MITDVSQRWREGRDGFRVYGERINPLDYEVVHVKSHRIARVFVEGHHYLASWPNAIEVFELYRKGSGMPAVAPILGQLAFPLSFGTLPRELVGIAVFSEPGGAAVLTKWFPGFSKEALELGRLVLLDDVPGDGETWFMARCFELLRREGYSGVVSFSDPMPRVVRDGRTLFPGHIGRIYLAFSGMFTGRSAKETMWLFDDATTFPGRCRTKIRAYAFAKDAKDLKTAKGWHGSVERLIARGAPAFPFEPGDKRGAQWVDDFLTKSAVPYRHPGMYRFLWGLNGSGRRAIRRLLRDLKLDTLKHPRVLVPGKLHVQRDLHALGPA